jgi:Phosphodiester glycosidase
MIRSPMRGILRLSSEKRDVGQRPLPAGSHGACAVSCATHHGAAATHASSAAPQHTVAPASWLRTLAGMGPSGVLGLPHFGRMLVVFTAALVGCTRSHGDTAAHAAAPDTGVPSPPTRPPMPSTLAALVEHTELSSEAGTLHRFRIPLSRARFSYVDLGYARPVTDALDGHALVLNGGYWAYRGEARVIQGLLSVGGKPYAPRAGSAGAVVWVDGEGAHMAKTGEEPDVTGAELAIQCSPRLVIDGRVVAKLDPLHHAPRTALCIGADSAYLDVLLTADGVRPTLEVLARALVAAGCVHALNLDGGPSTGAALARAGEPLRVGLGAPVPYAIAVDAR